VVALEQITQGTAEWTSQDESQVTYAAKVTKQEMLLDPADAVIVNKRRAQASLDAAPARAVVAGRGVRVLGATQSDVAVAEGDVLVKKGRLYLGCADGAVELLRVKPDGKKEMAASAWASGLRGADLTWERA